MKEEKYKEALETLENAMLQLLQCDKEPKTIPPSGNKISELKNKKLNGVPIQWRLLRAEVKRKNINVNFFNNEKYEEAIQKYDELIKECKEIYLTKITLVILLRNKCSCLIKVYKSF